MICTSYFVLAVQKVIKVHMIQLLKFTYAGKSLSHPGLFPYSQLNLFIFPPCSPHTSIFLSLSTLCDLPPIPLLFPYSLSLNLFLSSHLTPVFFLLTPPTFLSFSFSLFVSLSLSPLSHHPFSHLRLVHNSYNVAPASC